MPIKTTIIYQAILLIGMISGVLPIQAAEQQSFDYSELKNTMTVCEKRGVLWAVHFGKNKQGYVVYAIFNKGKEPSPVSSGNMLKSDGTQESFLRIEIDGKNVPAPDLEMNSMIIEDGIVKRGKFKPMIYQRFREFLGNQTSLTLGALEDMAGSSGEESK